MRKFTFLFKAITITTILSLVLVTASIGFGSTANTLNTAPEEFARQSIAQISQDVPDCTWNTDTQISETIKLYDMDLTINGYIFNLSTDGNQSGFMQILINDTEYDVISYSFGGTHSLDKMLAACESVKHFNKNSKIIYIGGTDYLVKEDNGNSGKYYSLSDQISFTVDKNQMKVDYKEMKAKVKAENKNKNKVVPGSLTASAAGVTKYVTGADYQYLISPYYIDNMISLFSSNIVRKHSCGPLAGANIIKYWVKARGKTNLYNYDDWGVFSALHASMQTDVGTTGTTYANVVAGLERYSVSNRGVPIAGKALYQGSLNFTTISSLIDQNRPFVIGVSDYTSPLSGAIPGNHAITCFGYSTASGYDQVIISDTWAGDWIFQSIGSINLLCFAVVWW